ncbi:MAG: glutathione peroxidase [Firmicutes bacterium]|nr:glutathione peroxidase [Bacillota bacterium]
MLTPLEYAFQITDNIEGIAFAATQDPIADYSEIKKLCTRCTTELFTVSGGNHSLETGDVINDIKNLGYFAHNFEEYISGNKKTVYDFSARLHDGRETDFSKFKGKVLLIVNTATGCGFTPQYTEIESIYNKYKEDGFEVLDFPCNQFMNQAPGTSEEIHSFCRARYSISFDQFEKIEVNGEREFPLYTYLKEKRGFEGFDLSTQNGRFLDHKAREIDPEYETNNDIKWNFTKFLIDRNGHVLSRYEPLTDMNTIEDDIKRLL